MNKIPCKICKHLKKSHNPDYDQKTNSTVDCKECVGISSEYIPYHLYQPDNLSYIENLAKERKLL